MKICFLAASNSIHSHQWINFFSNLGHKIIWISLVPTTIKVLDDIEYYEFTSGIFSSIFPFSGDEVEPSPVSTNSMPVL